MRRDMDLIREILFKLESRSEAEEYKRLVIDGHDSSEISYHIMLLHDAGLILARDQHVQQERYWLPGPITWAGHEFLDAARSNSSWAMAKTATGRAGAAGFEVLKRILVEIGVKAASGQLGI